MAQRRWISSLVLAVIAVIGCGGSTPQDADSVPAKPAEAEPIQLAQAMSAMAPVAASGAAEVTGVAKFSGEAPERKKIKMSADPVCQQQHAEAVYDEGVVVNENATLRNVFLLPIEGAFASCLKNHVANIRKRSCLISVRRSPFGFEFNRVCDHVA